MITVAEYKAMTPEQQSAWRDSRREYFRRVNFENCGAVQKAIERHDWPWLSGWIYGQLGVMVGEQWCESAITGFMGLRPEESYQWSDGSWRMWFKAQLIKGNFFSTGRQPTVLHILTATLHTGFTHLIETDEELERLRVDDWKPTSGPQTPAIERTMNKPEPINRVALRVVGWKDE